MLDTIFFLTKCTLIYLNLDNCYCLDSNRFPHSNLITKILPGRLDHLDQGEQIFSKSKKMHIYW